MSIAIGSTSDLGPRTDAGAPITADAAGGVL